MSTAASDKLPTYFIGHGGVSILFKPGYGPVQQDLREIGKEIKALKPEAIVITCGHFQSENDTIQVNLKEPTKVWHDLGPSWHTTFPHVFEYQYPHKSSRALGEKVLRHLVDQGIKAEGVERDLDHGVWVPFKLMFPDGEDELDIPILEVSTYDGNDLDAHVRLGEALSSLPGRILIIGSGMIVHNLRATREGTAGTTVARSVEQAALKSLAAPTPRERDTRFLDLQKREDWVDAHPTEEHVLPLYVTLGVGRDWPEYKVWNQDRYIIGQSYLSFRLGALPATSNGLTGHL
ncbi:Extradiol ring-cleavage dioxygenase, class III enzyme, subunit B [Aspergillus sclerotioniger CBS 115572]|uniref:Extradiol ring-cleavage dioxygenase, class III enzyme, subunit B n=1 Tax=Aspergillus sclerotioniger CBS 115572 TaxID=1450535 RepID=A0A317W6P4_9EURO|nr:Extradiol ring-cleavage dioxygenase, class III enzyme, subunit B [Aspergillus sclerotioniger CBS 115572]PWY81625.1 Extradiol ring-cleavage dioxygenase, class III enzyme, subunit B [Aspergillus sclerotioniger CBS 115572]